MAEVTYILRDGGQRQVTASSGSVMAAAMQNNVPGILAECGGGCACATCHVYVDPAWIDRLPPPDEIEAELLDGVAAERRPNSRLSCQIMLSADLDGLVVQMPEAQ
ncbi:2Fe-2S iron-sulfur cluster-binding protein [Niveispirillum sp. KHB5.9]|uniref:2Fe-2S iron-sulfur cluster-binding protein n=1 Tax=Niveispirillum sp. KHB5.9 TaxID=3400269 RepID=UPI003A8609EE